MKLAGPMPAEAEDAQEIRALMARVIEATITVDSALLADTVANVNDNVDVWLAQPERCVHLKMLAGSRIVGVVLVKDFWNLCSLFVAPQWQGRGVGRALMQSAIDHCAPRTNEPALLLNATPNAVPFYLRMGFEFRQPSRALPPGFRAMQRYFNRQ